MLQAVSSSNTAAILVGELCALGYSYPNIKHYTKKEVFAAFRVVYRGRNGTKNGILGVIWRRRAERGPNQRGEPAGRALYRRRGRSPRPTGGWMSARALHSLRSLRFRGSGRILLAQQAQRGRRWNADPTGKTRNNLNNFLRRAKHPPIQNAARLRGDIKVVFTKLFPTLSRTPKLPAAKATKCYHGLQDSGRH